MPRLRLDLRLVDLGLVESREKAQRLIRAGQVRVNSAPADKPGHLVAEDAVVELLARDRFVSRGGEKLEEAFRRFPISVEGAVCVDFGASTGGFTDCLLQHGAARVYAIDVGRAQLHPRVAADPRVIPMEGVNARHLDAGALPEPCAFGCADVSFISLERMLGPLRALVRPGGTLITLVKPQFEAGRAHVEKGGVVRDPAVRRTVLDRIRAFGETEAGLRWRDVCASPLRGPAGNMEYLAWWSRP
jgi:23S rRNA (cytidine1920-2'-O)/16S rRNA (cytidine1409-2'-O)-methyltransferase